MTTAAQSVAIRARLVAAGLCVECEEPHVGPPMRCAGCTALAAQRKREREAVERERRKTARRSVRLAPHRI